jgi:hypothetical protein
LAERIYKHAEYLSQFKDCPSTTCSEIEREIFRWVHNPPTDANFVPLPLMPYQILIDASDKEHKCTDYSLSVWDTLEIARAKFLEQYNRKHPNKRIEYIANKGDSVALIHLKREHGVLSENKEGHYSLFEYSGVNLHNDIKKIFSIFD